MLKVHEVYNKLLESTFCNNLKEMICMSKSKRITGIIIFIIGLILFVTSIFAWGKYILLNVIISLVPLVVGLTLYFLGSKEYWSVTKK